MFFQVISTVCLELAPSHSSDQRLPVRFKIQAKTFRSVHILYNGLKGGGGFRNLLYALYEGERVVCADVI